jgi:hypothetical protein
MNDQLDQRIRRLVVEVVDNSPAPPRFDELAPLVPQRRPNRRIVVVAVAALTVIALAFGAAWFVRDERSAPVRPARSGPGGVVRLPLDAIPQGVSTRLVDRTPVFVVREQDRVTVFLTDTQHLPSDRMLWWCPRERVFRAPLNGETFDADGHAVGGPVRYGLDRFATELRGRIVNIDVTRVIPDDAPRQSPPSFPPGSTSFCSDALKSRTSSLTNLRIEALPTLKYDAERYTVPAGIVDIRLIGRGGTHTLVFKRENLRTFELKTPGGPTRSKVKLEPGRYLVFCSIPGHRSAGERATIVVRPKYAPSGDQS